VWTGTAPIGPSARPAAPIEADARGRKAIASASWRMSEARLPRRRDSERLLARSQAWRSRGTTRRRSSGRTGLTAASACPRCEFLFARRAYGLRARAWPQPRSEHCLVLKAEKRPLLVYGADCHAQRPVRRPR